MSMITRRLDFFLFFEGDSTSEDPHGYSSRVGNDSDDSPESSNSGKYADGDEREKRRAGGSVHVTYFDMCICTLIILSI